MSGNLASSFVPSPVEVRGWVQHIIMARDPTPIPLTLWVVAFFVLQVQKIWLNFVWIDKVMNLLKMGRSKIVDRSTVIPSLPFPVYHLRDRVHQTIKKHKHLVKVTVKKIIKATLWNSSTGAGSTTTFGLTTTSTTTATTTTLTTTATTTTSTTSTPASTTTTMSNLI